MPTFSITIQVTVTDIPGIAEFAVTSDCPFELEPEDMVEILQETATFIKEHPQEYTG